MSDEAAPASTVSPAQKAIERLSESIDSGDLYQALQLFKTQHARAKKKGDVSTATELAFRGANLMLEKGQVNSGSELARDFIELLKINPSKPYDDKLKELLQIDSAFGKMDHEDQEILRERKRFLKLALEFTCLEGPFPRGAPELHLNYARLSLKEKNVLEANKHYLNAHKVDEFCDVLVAWAKNGPESERDLYLTRAVLQLLCLENLRDANLLYAQYRRDCPNLDENSALLKFVSYLLRVLERDAYPLFQTLRQKYAASLARGGQANGQNQFEANLDRIAFVFYGVSEPKTGMANMMETMMKGLF